MIGTKQIRFHFKNKYVDQDIKKHVVRALRQQHKSRNKGDNGIDQLVELLKTWNAEGGVGLFQYDNMEIIGIQFQHPLLRDVAKMFGKVTTMDATHNTTQHDKSLLTTVTGQDSFGKLYHGGCSYEASENAEDMQRLLRLLGIEPETIITDASKASFTLVQALKCSHIVCSFHYRRTFSQSMESLDATERKAIWEAVMKALKWQGYKDDADLVKDIAEILKKYCKKNAKLDTALDTLKRFRQVLCAFHTKKFFGFGKTSSQLSECVHAQIKGGNSYARWLRANSYVESVRHIVASMKLYVDETVTRIQACVAAKKFVSDWVAEKLQSSIGHVARCLNPAPRLNATNDIEEQWLLFETVPCQGYLPSFQQKHEINIPSPTSRSQTCTCKCPYYTSTRLPCAAICAVLAQRSIHSVEQLAPHLDSMWLVVNHPIYHYATSPQVLQLHAMPAVSTTSHHGAVVDSETWNAAALRATSLPSDAGGRSLVLSSLWLQVFASSAQSVQHSRNLYDLLVRHRASLSHSTILVVAPASSLTVGQLNSQLGPADAVANLYNRSAKKRVLTSRGKDPSCYSVHKQAAPLAEVKCLCGISHINDHKVRFHCCNYSCDYSYCYYYINILISFNSFRLLSLIVKQSLTKNGCLRIDHSCSVKLMNQRRPVYRLQHQALRQPVYRIM